MTLPTALALALVTTLGAPTIAAQATDSWAAPTDAPAQAGDGAARGWRPDPATDLDGEGFLRAVPGRGVHLPADHGSHPSTRTEWWYVTGALDAADGREFGFQATWFRRALVAEARPDRSPLAVRDVILFHGALSDVSEERQFVTEEASRAAEGWAHAAPERLDVALFDHVFLDDTGDGRAARLAFGAGPATLDLELTLDASPPLLHGDEPGLSLKGHERGQASWYYSLTDLPVRGRLRLGPGEEPVEVSGSAWFDHEFGSSQLADDQEGWDWFSVVLDDGTELMLYLLRRVDGTPDTTSGGTLRLADGTRRVLHLDDLVVEPTGSWRSEDSGATYPSGWRLAIPAESLELTVEPTFPDQEVMTPGTTGVTYWEGLCRFRGLRDRDAVQGRGYVELVGYGRPITDRFAPAPEPDSDR